MAKKTLRTASNEVISNLRLRCMASLREGRTQAEVAKLHGVGLSTLKSWVKQYKEKGSKIYTLKKRGVKKGSRDISNEQIRKIKKMITDKLPDQLKLPFALWNRQAVQNLMYKKFGIKKSLPQIGRYLQAWGFSPQKPIYKAYEQNPESVKQWIKKDFPAIKEKAKKEKAEIYFGDEAGMRSDHHSGKSYSPKGKTPIVKKTGQRFSVNMISAISARGGKRFMLYRGKFNSGRYIQFLKQLIKKALKKIYLIMDNYSVHKTKQVQQWLSRNHKKINVYYLPTHSPELNPDELLNQDVKTNALGKHRASNADELRANIKSYLKKLPKQKIANFFQHPIVKYAA